MKLTRLAAASVLTLAGLGIAAPAIAQVATQDPVTTGVPVTTVADPSTDTSNDLVDDHSTDHSTGDHDAAITTPVDESGTTGTSVPGTRRHGTEAEDDLESTDLDDDHAIDGTDSSDSLTGHSEDDAEDAEEIEEHTTSTDPGLTAVDDSGSHSGSDSGAHSGGGSGSGHGSDGERD